MNELKYRILGFYVTHRDRLIKVLRLVVVPGFGGVPLYDVLVFFVKGLFEGSVSTRAAAVSYNFFLAIFPFILFLFTLIPYIPVADFQLTLFSLFREIIPPETFAMVEKTIYEIVMLQNTGLLSLSFILTFYFSTNGVNAIMDGFNSSLHSSQIRNWWRQRLTAIFLMIVLSVLVILAITFITVGSLSINWLIEKGFIKDDLTVTLLEIVRWLIILLLTFFSVSFLYYFGPAERRAYAFFSPGSILATFLLIIGTLGFNIYIANFSTYNALYGSIGTLIIFLVWIFISAFILLIGFELNASIRQAKIVWKPN
ncbi:MAG: YihY/virulence factor BrkB family protein [Bacteroidales bacterium]|nr:YihY/virulence factor BrkB family protein [Bacteroidales bacterium]